MESVKMQIDGEIINELTENISSNHVALVELIKNAYDADANVVNITFNKEKGLLIIADDGKGMDNQNIQSLLHIAKSNKQYGKVRENGRIVQGEKGLGALSAFKFGDKVTWETVSDDGILRTFSLDKAKLIIEENLGDYAVPVETTFENKSTKGTTITIQVNTNNIEYYSMFFANSIILNKIANNFIVIQNDNEIKDMDIIFNIDGKKTKKQNINYFKSIAMQRQIFNIKYSSESEDLIFYKNNIELFREKYPMPSSDYTCVAEFVAYDFTGGRPKDFDGDDTLHLALNSKFITPLLYINQSFLPNYQYFNPDDSRYSQSGKSLPQLTGYIHIHCNSDELIYNPDRSGLIENRLTQNIIDFLRNFNLKIQEIGAANKKYFVPNYHISSLIKQQKLNIFGVKERQREVFLIENITQDYRQKYPFKICDSGNFVEYNFFGNDIRVPIQSINVSEQKTKSEDSNTENDSKVQESTNKNKLFKQAIIELSQNKIEKTIGSAGQIDLYRFIDAEKTVDSTGNRIPFGSITFKDSKQSMIANNILPSVDSPQNIEITYSYLDKNTGNTSNNLTIVFVSPPKIPMTGKTSEESLIHTHGIGNFEATFDTVAAKLVNQINSLKYDDYVEMISCSLRTLFEMGVDSIRNISTESAALKSLQSTIASGGLDKNVKAIVAFVKERKNRTKIEEHLKTSCSNVSFHTLDNIANPDRISTHASESNLGAHKGTTNLTKQQIVAIANDVSAYLIFVEGIIGASDSL